MEVNEITSRIIGAAIEVHRHLGPGLLESAYEECLAHELSLRGVSYRRQHPLPLAYKGRTLDCGYRLDFLVEETVIVELKACERIEPIHTAQVLTSLRLTGCPVDLLINFNTPVLKDGIHRIVLTPSRG